MLIPRWPSQIHECGEFALCTQLVVLLSALLMRQMGTLAAKGIPKELFPRRRSFVILHKCHLHILNEVSTATACAGVGCDIYCTNMRFVRCSCPPTSQILCRARVHSCTGRRRGGVLEPRCYGCGRCIDVCPPGIIHAETYMRSPQNVRSLLEKVDAVEIHTKV